MKKGHANNPFMRYGFCEDILRIKSYEERRLQRVGKTEPDSNAEMAIIFGKKFSTHTHTAAARQQCGSQMMELHLHRCRFPSRILNYGRPPAFVKGYGFKENLMQRIEKQPYEERKSSAAYGAIIKLLVHSDWNLFKDNLVMVRSADKRMTTSLAL